MKAIRLHENQKTYKIEMSSRHSYNIHYTTVLKLCSRSADKALKFFKDWLLILKIHICMKFFIHSNHKNFMRTNLIHCYF